MWKRYLWVKNILFIVLFAYLAAKIGNTVVVAYLLPDTTPGVAQTTPSPKPRGTAGKKSLRQYSPIAKQSIFNSEHTGEEAATTAPRKPKSTEPLKKSELNVKLIGTIVGPPDESYAIIEDPREREQQLYEINDMIQDTARVLRISRCKVVLLRDGVEEVLECLEDEDKDRKKPSPVRYAASEDTGNEHGVRKVSESEYMIDEGEVENALNNINQLMTQIRVVPNFQDGEANGFKVFAIKPKSIFAQIGLKNGDVIKKVNDQDITTPDKAFQAFQELRNEKNLNVEILRRGQQKSLNYEIR